MNLCSSILGDPGAASRDNAIFSGVSLLQGQKSPSVLILTEPVPEVFEFPAADWPEKYFSGQSARRSTQATLCFLIFSGHFDVSYWYTKMAPPYKAVKSMVKRFG